MTGISGLAIAATCVATILRSWERTRKALWVVPATALVGCAHVTNAPLCATHAVNAQAGCTYDPAEKTSYRFAPRADNDTLVVVTFSGGGTRAAALAYGTLQTLNTMEGTHGGKLLDQVNIISSVSGGSVTAGWYALNGRAGLEDPHKRAVLLDFLQGRWMGRLIWAGINPLTLLRYTFTPYTRSDVLADFFAYHLYGKATYADVLRQYKSDPSEPYVILNATDLGHETVFPFTQGRFDFLCSDLLQYPVADAVAASANFPLAFSPLGLKNFSKCDVQSGSAWLDRGPPKWLKDYAPFDDDHNPQIHSYALSQLRAARLSNDYLQPSPLYPPDGFIHLLDGGVSDNLGIRSTLALEDDPARVPGLYLRLGPERPEGYQNISRVLYIVVNARTRDPGRIDRQQAPTGEVTTALRMSDTQLDTSTLADQDFLIAELEATANRANSNPVSKHSLRFYVASVDFEMIPDKKCRDQYWQLNTNWGLRSRQVQGLIEMAGVILSRSPDMQKFYDELQLKAPPPQDFTQVCALVAP